MTLLHLPKYYFKGYTTKINWIKVLKQAILNLSIMIHNNRYLTKLSHWPYWYPCLCWAHSLSAQPGDMDVDLDPGLDIPGQAGDTHTLHSLSIIRVSECLVCWLCLPCPILLAPPLDAPSSPTRPRAGWPGPLCGGLVTPGRGLGGRGEAEGGQDHEVLKLKIEASLFWAPS